MRRLVSKLKGIDLRMEEAPSLPLGFMEVATAQEIAVDIIAIHGLHGHREGTWTAKKTGVMWLRDLLPAKIPNARILTYGYDAATQSSSPISVLSLFDQATSFAEQLSQIRSANDRRPIIFIAHCLGGIIVKHALVYCNMAGPQHLPHLRNIALSTYGILFFGTPHLGANGVDAASWLINISSIFMHTSDKMVKHLRLDSEHLQQLGVQFVPISHDFNTVFFCETIPTKLMNSRKILVVPHSSAAIPGAVNMQDVQLHRNHIDMVRYDSSEDNEFNRVVSYLSNMVKNAPSVVFNKWKDQNIQNPTHSRSKILIPVKLPFSKNPRFKGRSDELAKIKDIFTQDCDNMKIIVLHGLGGVGKTELVMEVAMQHKADFTALFWLNATNLETLQASFASAAQQLLDTEYKSGSGHQPLSETIRDLGLQGLVDDTGILIPEKLATTKGEIVEAIRNWLSKEDNTQWLLIIDNLDDVESFEKDSYLPMCTNGTILITSRRYESKHLGNFAIEIGDMDPISACQLLVARAGKTYSSLRETDKQEVEQIVKFLGYLPLAIELAGAYIDIQMISFQEYLPRYKSRFQDLMGDLPLGPQRYKEPVYTTWEMSYNMIENINKDAATLLATLGFLSNEILQELIIRSNILSESVLEKAIAKLVSYSLIKLKNEPCRIWIHPVVHEWLQERKTIAEKQKYTKEAIKIISHAIHSDTVRTADDWRFEVMILSDLHACVRNNQKYLSSLEDCDIEIAWEIGKIGKIFEFQGLYNHAADLLSQSSKVLTSKLKPNNVNLLENKQDLAQVYVCQRRFPEAETIFREISAAVGEVNDSSDDSLGIRAQCGLAGVLQYQHRYAEAEELYQTVITGLKAANVEADHPFFLATMSNLAQLYGGQGKLEQAKELFYDVLKKKEEVLGVDHPSTIASLNGLAAIYYNQGNFDEAAKHYAKGADIEKTVVLRPGVDLKSKRRIRMEMTEEWNGVRSSEFGDD